MRRDSYLDHVCPGMKMDTWNELRNAALFGYGLFPDAALNVAEQDINKFETQHVSVQSRVGPQHQQKTKYRYKPYEKKEAKTMVQRHLLLNNLGDSLGHEVVAVGVVLLTTVFPSMPGVAKIINDNHCTNPRNQIIPKIVGQNISSQTISKTAYSRTAVIPVPIVVGPGQPQKKGLSPDLCQTEIKHVKSASFVSPCRSVPHVPNVHSVAENPPVGCRLHRFWETWLSLGSNPRVVSILKDGYNLPFKMRPPLTRCPLIISGYANPRRNKFLKEALQSLITKQAVEKVVVRASLAFYNRLFIVPKPNNKWRLGFEQTQSFPPLGNLQNGNSGDHPAIPSKRRMGHIAGFQRCLFPHSHQPKVEEVSQVSPARSNLPVQGSAVRPSDGSFGIHKGGEGGEIDGPVQGYKDPPVPRRLVASSSLSGELCEPNPDPDGSVSAVGMVSQFAKVGTCSPTGVQLCRLSFRPLQGSSEADSGEVANPNSKNKDANEQRPLFGPRVHVSHRFVDSHRETGGFGAPSHETDSVALEESLARARGPREGDSSSQISIPSSAVVAGQKQCAQRPTSSSSATCSAVVYRRLKRRLGRALR